MPVLQAIPEVCGYVEVVIQQTSVFQSCRKRGAKGEILSNMLERVGIRCEKNPDLSERFCKACAGKLRRTFGGFNFIASNIIATNIEFGLEEEDEVAGHYRNRSVSIM